MRQEGMRESSELNSSFQKYSAQLFACEQDDLFQQSKKFAEQLGKLSISISAGEGRLLQFFTSLFKCKKFVEIGTLTGYSALWIAKGMQQGELFTLEKEEAHAKCAQLIFDEFKSDVKISLKLGSAEESLREIQSQGPFDGVFIDGNKSAYVSYLDWAEKNLKIGGLIIADNVFLGGAVFGEENPRFSDKQVRIMQEFNHRLSNTDRYESCLVPTSEGLFVARLKA